MRVSVEHDRDNNALTIRVHERFDFSVHKHFRDAYQRIAIPPRSYIIDLAETEDMDSSALGMLLLLREYAGGERAEIHIVNCKPALQHILSIVGFGDLFTLH